MQSEKLIFKVCSYSEWQNAEKTGVYIGAPVDVSDGFIHFSTAAQLAETVKKHFAGQENLIVVAIPTAALGEALKWEPSRGGALFPHLYSDLFTAHALWTKPLPLVDGEHALPELDQA